jgi:predicted transcriptional regulator
MLPLWLSVNHLDVAYGTNFENRTICDVPVILAVTEKDATLCFRFLDGRVDYASFSGSDPMFLNWVKDLFLYYWNKGKRA